MRVWRTYVRMLDHPAKGVKVSADFPKPTETANLLFINPDGMTGIEIWWSDESS